MSKLLTAMLPMHSALLAAAQSALASPSVESVPSVVKSVPPSVALRASVVETSPLPIDRASSIRYELTRIHTELQSLRERTEDLPNLHRHLLSAEYELAEALNSHL